jgi:hypothetical protein
MSPISLTLWQSGAKRRKGNKVHLAVDTLGHLLALCVTAADEQDQAQVAELARRVQAETGETLKENVAEASQRSAISRAYYYTCH